jgi:dTDP-glucose 4,6-dehydratase
MRILVTGAAGFIGRYVCRELAAHGHHVFPFHGGTYADALSVDLGIERNSLIADLARGTLLFDALMPPMRPHAIVNLASESHVERSIESPVPFIMANVAIAANMLEWARWNGVQKFIQFSTDEVFGPAPEGHAPFREHDAHCPSNPYAASKSAQEQIATAYWRTYGLPVVITRTMNNFGFGQHAEKFIPKTVRLLLAGEHVPVHAERSSDPAGWDFESANPHLWRPGSRMWLHASSTASAIRFILEDVEATKYPAADRPTTLHIAGEREIDNAEIVRMAARVLGVEPKIEYVDFHKSRPGHDRRYAIDGSLIQSLGWRPDKDFDATFAATVKEIAAWQRTH